jgi:hypothetical protein
MWHSRLWLIDHGAALYFQHAWHGESERAQDPFARIKDHILLPYASQLSDADRIMTERLTPDVIRGIVELVPDAWLGGEPAVAYTDYLIRRLAAPRRFVEEAIRARALL